MVCCRSPAEAREAYEAYKMNADKGRMVPLQKPDDPNDKGKSTSNDYLGVGVQSEDFAITSLTNRRPGVDTVRDDTWNARDDVSTLGRPSTDARPDLDEVKSLLHKASTAGKRKGGATLSPYATRPSTDFNRPPPLPLSVNPQGSNHSNQYASPPQPLQPTLSMHRSTAPGSPNSISTGQIEEYQFQTMVPPPRSNSRPRVAMTAEEREREQEEEGRRPYGASGPSGSTNPYRSQSPPVERFQYKRE